MSEAIVLNRHPNFQDLTGRRYGRISVVEYRGIGQKKALWLCRCDCGKEKIVTGRVAKRGQCVRCPSKFRIKRPREALRNVFDAMHGRCENLKNQKYVIYGGRGIVVCERWKSFQNFCADMGERPAGTTIDRIDNDGNYELGNCRWIDMKQQQRNRRNNRLVQYLGRTMCLAEALEITGIHRSTIVRRLARGDSIEMALGRGKRRLNI